jgi:hypothetical protein
VQSLSLPDLEQRDFLVGVVDDSFSQNGGNVTAPINVAYHEGEEMVYILMVSIHKAND